MRTKISVILFFMVSVICQSQIENQAHKSPVCFIEAELQEIVEKIVRINIEYQKLEDKHNRIREFVHFYKFTVNNCALIVFT